LTIDFTEKVNLGKPRGTKPPIPQTWERGVIDVDIAQKLLRYSSERTAIEKVYITKPIFPEDGLYYLDRDINKMKKEHIT